MRIDSVVATASHSGQIIFWNVHLSGSNYASNICKDNCDNVACIKWSNNDLNILYTGCRNGQIYSFDKRNLSSGLIYCNKYNNCIRTIEHDPFNSNNIIYGTDDGVVMIFDIRMNKDSGFENKSHNGPTLCIKHSKINPNIIATGGRDKTVNV